LLTDEQYAAGIERIEAAIMRPENGETPVFKAEVAMTMVRGRVDSCRADGGSLRPSANEWRSVWRKIAAICAKNGGIGKLIV
jgi:hypothetical protein